jgi:hypothetical protein
VNREYYKDIGYKPFLFFVIFGVSGDELEVSAKRHKVDMIPEKLDIHTLTRLKNRNYIDGFFTGSLGNILKSKDENLFEQCRATDKCAILQGDIMNDSTFDYMRNVIGIVQAFVDKGAVGILDV